MRRAKNSTLTGSLTNSLEMTLTTSATQSSAHTNSGSITPTQCSSANHQSNEEPASLSDGELLGEEKKPSHKVLICLECRGRGRVYLGSISERKDEGERERESCGWGTCRNSYSMYLLYIMLSLIHNTNASK